MKTKRSILVRVIILLVVCVVVIAVIFLVVIPSSNTWAISRALSQSLNDAHSITLVEFERSPFGPELIFSRATASSRQIQELRAATDAWVAPLPLWHARCYTPHHRVDIVRADGSDFRFEICFHCDNFKLGNKPIVTMPAPWRAPLAKLFSDAGMPPREYYSEVAKQHPDYQQFQGDPRVSFDKMFDGIPEWLQAFF